MERKLEKRGAVRRGDTVIDVYGGIVGDCIASLFWEYRVELRFFSCSIHGSIYSHFCFCFLIFLFLFLFPFFFRFRVLFPKARLRFRLSLPPLPPI